MCKPRLFFKRKHFSRTFAYLRFSVPTFVLRISRSVLRQQSVLTHHVTYAILYPGSRHTLRSEGSGHLCFHRQPSRSSATNWLTTRSSDFHTIADRIEFHRIQPLIHLQKGTTFLDKNIVKEVYVSVSKDIQ